MLSSVDDTANAVLIWQQSMTNFGIKNHKRALITNNFAIISISRQQFEIKKAFAVASN